MMLEPLIYDEHLVTVDFHVLQPCCDPKELGPAISETSLEKRDPVQRVLLSSRMSTGGSHTLFAFPQQKHVVPLEALDLGDGFGQLLFEI